jgi:gamma-glutamyltranspeptidase/glutathione hydrolase
LVGFAAVSVLLALTLPRPAAPARLHKPPLHGRHWMAVTGKPLAAVAGARTFWKGGNAVDAACAMLAATCTLWDTLGWGGETQALVWHPGERRVIGVAGLGAAPLAATAALYREKGYRYPPEHGPLAAVVPGTPGALVAMLAEWGRLSLAEVLAPAIELADGFAIEAQLAGTIRRQQSLLATWPASRALFLPGGAPPEAGAVFRQDDLARTLRRLVEAERAALARGAARRDAILAAGELFYRGELARELAAAARAEGALLSVEDLARHRTRFEPSRSIDYRGTVVHKLDVWTQGPAMLQALELLEQVDLEASGPDSPATVHAVVQAMQMAFADRDFYYGDPEFPPAEPVEGLLSASYARERWRQFDPRRNREDLGPGDPYPHQGGTHPFAELLRRWSAPATEETTAPGFQVSTLSYEEAFRAGTTSIEAADAEGWVVSMTPSGAWVPAVVAGATGIGLSQRMQSFVLAEEDGPYNVLEPGKRPRVTLTPTLALQGGEPLLAFAVQGGDTQDQNLLQFFLNVVEFGRGLQESAEAAHVTTHQLRSSFGAHAVRPGVLTLRADAPEALRAALVGLGYRLEFEERTSGPITAIRIDREHGTFWGAASNHGEDTGLGW